MHSTAQLLGASVLVFLCGCEGAITRSVGALVLATEGNVSNTVGSAAPQTVRPNLRVASGASLSTSADARLALSLLPGALADLEPQSELRLESLKITKNGNRLHEAIEREVRLTLINGTLVASIAFESEGARASIETPQGTLLIGSRSLCRIQVHDQITRVTCARGAVSFQPHGDAARVALQAPESREWPLQELDAIPADFDARTMEEIENSKAVEQKLLGLEQRRRLSPFPWRQ